ncbi:Ssu1p [Sporobolomyces salmoneus]|uniref:Ssu1p n=1 Tax=Sporobolomyces salmoneus TaxID=183962 RepID=UPI00317A7A07
MTSSLASALPSMQRRNTPPAYGDRLSPLETALSQSSESSTSAEAEGPALSGRITWSKHPWFTEKVRGLRLRAIRFTSSWFSVVMGTGIINSLMYNLPWESSHAVFRGLGAAWLILAMIMFLVFSILTITRYTIYPRIATVMLKHETHSLFLGCIPMGLVTIVSGIALTGHEYGLKTLDTACVLWWFSLVLSILTSFGVPIIIFTLHHVSAETFTAAWLLPLVPPSTVAATGTSICKLLMLQGRYTYAFVILITSYVILGIALMTASAIMVLYLNRLLLHKLPPKEVIVSALLPVGAVGQGGYALLEAGKVASRLFPIIADQRLELAALGMPLYGVGLVSGLFLWGLGLWFLFLAFVSVGVQFAAGSKENSSLPFNIGLWGFTFPIGSLCLLTFGLADTLNSMFFKVVSTILTALVFVLWVCVFIPTAMGFFRGTLFAAPCLANLPKEYVEKVSTPKPSRPPSPHRQQIEREREEIERASRVA